MPYIKTPEKPFARVARLLRGYGTPPVIAEKIKASPQTMRRRLDNPADLTLGELRTISMNMHIPKEEIIAAITW